MPFISGFQGLVNGWIKVNSKHVVITNTTADSNSGNNNGSNAMDGNSHASSRRGRSSGGDNDSQGQTTATSNAFSNSADPEISAIKKYNKSKRNRRKLERTVSLTDLLREVANEKGSKQQQHNSNKSHGSGGSIISDMANSSSQKKAASSGIASISTTSDIGQSVANSASQGPCRDDQSLDSFRFVAGFFGADIPPPPPALQQPQQQQPVTADNTIRTPPQQQQSQHQHAIPMGHPQHPRIINTSGQKWSPSLAGHKQQQQQQQFETPMRQNYRSSHDASVGAAGAATGGDAASIRSMHRSDSLGSNYKGDFFSAVPPPASMRGTPPLHPTQNRDNDSRSKQSNPMQQFFKNLPGNNKRCGSCDDYESRLLAMAADMDYLRSEALRNEYICRECRCHATDPASSHKQPTVVVSTSSHRLAEMEAAHLAQIEQQMQERSQWQKDMHYKLSKFATIAKDLNEESALRKQEALKLEDDLMDVKAERDLLALEVSQLRATTAQHEVERIDHRALKDTVKKYEEEGLERARETIDQRDDIIRDLAGKLERALGMVEIERMKQRQRRQIIFPVRASHPLPSGLHSIIDGSVTSLTSLATTGTTEPSFDEQLRLAKEQAHAAQMKFELSQADAVRTAAAFRQRVEHLERRLDSAEPPA